ncbi:hypothetical protein F5146DRAFT_1146474 [Armillaria mellea]|nr:hypothetical protein F5146DRAFT_1146474 [Armillaria mellea]
MIPQSMVVLFYKAAIVVADVMMACLRHPGRLPYRDVHSTNVDNQTDDELLRLWDLAPEVECTHEGSPRRLTPDLVAKWVDGTPAGWPLEALAQDLIHNRTNIPMPPIRWVLYLDESACILVMDYIPGITLGEAWPTMRIWHKLRTALTLQSYGEKPGRCYASRIFGPMHPSKGPFATSEEFIELFNNGMDKAVHAHLCVHKGPLKDDGTLIYSHVDLAPRNLILGEDRQLWLIDFTTAGFYPRWFEYVNMMMDARLERGKAYDAMWWASILFIADPFLGIYDWVWLVAPECL